MCPQTLVRVDELVSGSILAHAEYTNLLNYVREHNNRLHIVMIFSDGGIHSHTEHLRKMLALLPEDINIQLHISADGRDVGSQSLPEYLREFSEEIQSGRIFISSLFGRYF